MGIAAGTAALPLPATRLRGVRGVLPRTRPAGPSPAPPRSCPSSRAPRDRLARGLLRARSAASSRAWRRSCCWPTTSPTHIVNGRVRLPAERTASVGGPGRHRSSPTRCRSYCDFSAYAGIAVGISLLLLGSELPRPLRRAVHGAARYRDFWRRWHMTLARWLRDYLYFPLGGNRMGRARTYREPGASPWCSAACWHGAGWTFVFWGHARHGPRG